MRGALMVLAIGLALLALAAVRDRQTRRRAERAAEGTVRPIPGLDDDTPPHHVRADDAELRRGPASLTPGQRRTMEQWCNGATRLDLQLADEALATHADPATAVLHDALVLVCSDGIASMRELLPIAEQAVRDQRSLVVVTPSCTPEVVDTLRVNLRAHRLRSTVLLGSPTDLDACCDATGATPVTRAVLQSGARPTTELGHAARLVATLDAVWVGADTD